MILLNYTRLEAQKEVNKVYCGVQKDHFHLKLVNEIYDNIDALQQQIKLLEAERANMQKTHRQSIAILHKRLANTIHEKNDNHDRAEEIIEAREKEISRLRSIIDGGPSEQVDVEVSVSVDNLSNQIDTAVSKLINDGYKECLVNFDRGTVKASVDRSTVDLEKYLKRHNIPKTSKFYYWHSNDYYGDLIAYGLGMQGVAGGYINGSAFINEKHIKILTN